LLEFAKELESGGVTPVPQQIQASGSSNASSLTAADGQAGGTMRCLADENGDVHVQCKRPLTVAKSSGKKYRKSRICSVCGSDTSSFCNLCDVSVCAPNSFNGRRDCFRLHVESQGQA